jgi:hypothetical protein
MIITNKEEILEKVEALEALYTKLYMHKESKRIKSDTYLVKKIIIMLDVIDILKEKIKRFYISKTDKYSREIESMISSVIKEAGSLYPSKKKKRRLPVTVIA